MILLAYDGSEDSRRALSTAGRLLDGNAIVVHVAMADPMMASPTSPGGTVLPTAPEIATETELIERARAIVDEGCALARDAGLVAEPVVERGAGVRGIWETILDVADAHDAHVIVVGRRGVSRLESALMGSVSNGLVQHANRPVLVIPAADEHDR